MQKIMALSFLGFIFLIACGTEDNGGDQITDEEPPIPALESEEGTIQVLLGSYCWGDQCVDAAGAPEIFEHEDIEPSPVNQEEELSIQMETFPDDIQVSRMVQDSENREDEGALSGNTITAPSEEGIYYYELFATWGEKEKVNEASATYAFAIEVK